MAEVSGDREDRYRCSDTSACAHTSAAMGGREPKWPRPVLLPPRLDVGPCWDCCSPSVEYLLYRLTKMRINLFALLAS